MKPKIADLERTMDYRIMQKHELHPLLRLARAAKAMSMCATLHFGEDRELMFDLDAALDAFDWGDK